MALELNRLPACPPADPREGQEWFQQMDERAQDLVRQRWIEDDFHGEEVDFWWRRGPMPDLLRGTLLVGGVHTVMLSVLAVLLSGFTGGIPVLNCVHQVAVACLVGAGLGWGARKANASVLTCAVSTGLILVVFEVIVGMHPFLAGCAGLAGGLLGRRLGPRRTGPRRA